MIFIDLLYIICIYFFGDKLCHYFLESVKKCLIHARTKIWPQNPEDEVLGFYGLAKIKFSKIKDFCKTQMNEQEMKQAFQEYKDNAYLLA